MNTPKTFVPKKGALGAPFDLKATKPGYFLGAEDEVSLSLEFSSSAGR